MSKLCFKEGAFLYLPGRELLILDQRARKRARQHNCGERHSLCLLCALLGGVISIELGERLQDPDFTLPPPLSVDTTSADSFNVSAPSANQSRVCERKQCCP